MAFFTRVTSCILEKLKKQPKNEVVPVKIVVQPRTQERIQDIGYQEHSDYSVFTVHDEPTFVRLWYSNNNRNGSTAAVPSPLAPSKDEREVIEMSNSSLEPSSSEHYVPTNYHYAQTSNQSKICLPRINTIKVFLTQNFCQKIWSSVIHVKSVISKVKRIAQHQSYIHAYMSMMYLFCVSAVNTNNPNNISGLHKWLQWLGSKLQLVTLTE